MATISDLDASEISQAELLLVQLLQDEYPSMDLSRGRVLRDLVIKPAAIFAVLNEDNMDRLRRSNSILEISQDPTLATDDIVDNTMSNLLLTRDDGAAASGQVRIIITDNVTTAVDSETVFTAAGLEFKATRAFTGVTSAANVVTTSSRLITSRSDGNFEFLVDIEAVLVGTEYNVSEGTRFTVAPTISGLVDVVSAGDFSGGRASEDNAALAAKAQLGLSPKVLSGRSHIEALLLEEFSGLADISIIGFADAEMTRDAHNLFGMSHGGKADIYARTASVPEKALISVTAIMLDSITKTLTVTLPRDTMAGAYDVLAVYRAGVTPFQLNTETEPSLVDSLTISSKSWGYNVTATGDEFVPDITTQQEAAYTRYRTIVLNFLDPASTLADGATATYQIYLLQMPDIADMQDFVNARDRRSPGADYLVRAPVGAVCSVGISVEARSVAEIDTDAIKNAIANRANGLGFSVGHLPASVVIDAAQGQLPADAVLNLPINMLAKLYLPDGTTTIITGTDELRVPVLSDVTVTARTVAFFLRASNIDVGVTELSTPGV